jgi:hypothetical protein
LSVVQDEAEHLFVSTASAVHGVREGATALTTRGGMDLASDADDEIDDPDLADGESLENDHGDRSDPDGSAQASPAHASATVRRSDEREVEYDLLTAALIGVAIGAGITYALRRGPSGSRRSRPCCAAWDAGRAGRPARGHARRGRCAVDADRGEEMWEPDSA